MSRHESKKTDSNQTGAQEELAQAALFPGSFLGRSSSVIYGSEIRPKDGQPPLDSDMVVAAAGVGTVGVSADRHIVDFKELKASVSRKS